MTWKRLIVSGAIVASLCATMAVSAEDSSVAFVPNDLSANPALFSPSFVHRQGDSSGAHINDHSERFKRGYVNRDVNNLQKLDAAATTTSFDKETTAQEAAKRAEIAQGHVGEAGNGAGSSGAEKKQLLHEFNRGSNTAKHLRKVEAQEAAASRRLDTGTKHEVSASKANIGGSANHLKHIGSSSGVDTSLQLANRRQRAEDVKQEKQQAVNAASNQQVFDRGSTKKSAASAATISQGAGYEGVGYGQFGSAGVEDASIDSQRERGFIREDQLSKAKKRLSVVDKSFQDNDLKKAKHSRSDIFGRSSPFSGRGDSSGASIWVTDKNHNKGTLHKARLDDQKLAATKSVKHLNRNFKRASKHSNVDIGQGLYEGSASKGAKAAVLVKGHDNEYANQKAVSSAKRHSASTARTFDTSHSKKLQASKANIAQAGGFPIPQPDLAPRNDV